MAIEISISQPYIPAGSGLEHTETRYQVARNPDMTDVVIDYTTTEAAELLHYNNDMSIARDEIFYHKERLTFNDGNFMESDIESLSYNRVTKVHVSSIYTPKISINTSTLDVGHIHMVVKLSELSMVFGTDQHSSTDWYVKNTSGEVLWERLFDEDNLTSMIIPKNIFIGRHVYVIEARQRTLNDESYVGRLLVANELSGSGIAVVSKRILYLNTDNVIKVRLGAITRSAITWSLRTSKHEYVYKRISSIIDSTFNIIDIHIDGRKLNGQDDYYLELETQTLMGDIVKREILLHTYGYIVPQDRYMIDAAAYAFVAEDHVDVPLYFKAGVSLQLENGYVPLVTDNKITFYELEKHIVTNEYGIEIPNIEKRSYQVMAANNIIHVAYLTRENVSEDNVRFDYTAYTTDITADEGLDRLSIVRNNKYNDVAGDDENDYFGTVSCLENPNGLRPGVLARLTNGGNFGLYVLDINDDYTVISGLDDLSNIESYYTENDALDRLFLNTLNMRHKPYVIVEKNNICVRLNKLDKTVMPLDTNDLVVASNRCYLFETIDGVIIMISEGTNDKAIFKYFNAETMITLREFHSDLIFDSLTFIRSLDHKLRMLEPYKLGHKISVLT